MISINGIGNEGVVCYGERSGDVICTVLPGRGRCYRGTSLSDYLCNLIYSLLPAPFSLSTLLFKSSAIADSFRI